MAAEDSSLPQPATIHKLMQDVYSSFAMLAGMQLDVFTLLKDGPLRVQQLATVLDVHVHPHRLRLLLYALVRAGLLTVDGDVFANTPEADRFLVQGRPAYMGGLHRNLAGNWQRTLQTAASIRSGVPQGKLDWSTMSTDKLYDTVFQELHALTVARGRDLATRYDFSPYRTLLDVGGGTGGTALTLIEAFPHLHATVVDLSSVTPITQRFVEESGATDRVHILTADVVQGPLPGTFDAAVLVAFLQVLSAERARQALRNIGAVIKPGGGLYIVGQVLDDTRLSPPLTVGMNLVFVNIFDEGEAYTEREYREWLAESGFEHFTRDVRPDGTSVITARKRV